ncbi:MAG: hypothetical protein NTY80_04355 [candidate division SR1 bacterium]|nr:hypothetical protein [candidate division SR1 bacterium]
MKNSTRKGFNKRITELKQDLKSVGSRLVVGASILAILNSCGSSDISKKVKAYDSAKQELIDAEANLTKQQKDVAEAQARLEKAYQDESAKKAELKEAAKNIQ